MNLDEDNFVDQVNLEHLLFHERTCRVCGKRKNLLDDFYLSYKDRKSLPSSYSYECKECTVQRVKKIELGTEKQKNCVIKNMKNIWYKIIQTGNSVHVVFPHQNYPF